MMAVSKQRADVGKPGAVRGGRAGGWGLVKEGQVSAKNDSEISGSQDIHCDTHGEVGVTPEYSLGHTGQGFYGNCCFSPVSGVSLNLNLALPRQVATSHGLRWDLEMEFGPRCAVLFLGVEHWERQEDSRKGLGTWIKEPGPRPQKAPLTCSQVS